MDKLHGITSQLNNYRSKVQCKAVQIVSKQYPADKTRYYYNFTVSVNGEDTVVKMCGKWVEKNRPVVGGYLLIHDDRTVTYCSEEQFNLDYVFII